MEGERDRIELWKLVAIVSMLGIILVPLLTFAIVASVNTFPEVMTSSQAYMIFMVCPTTLLVLMGINLAASIKTRKKKFAIPSIILFAIALIVMGGKGIGGGICLIYFIVPVIMFFLAILFVLKSKSDRILEVRGSIPTKQIAVICIVIALLVLSIYPLYAMFYGSNLGSPLAQFESTKLPGYMKSPSYSHNGEEIVYITRAKELPYTENVNITNSAFNQTMTLTGFTGLGRLFSTSFSHDNSMIVFTRNHYNKTLRIHYAELWLLSRNGDEWTSRLLNSFNGIEPIFYDSQRSFDDAVFSPDDDTIYFTSSERLRRSDTDYGGSCVYSINIHGTNLRYVTGPIALRAFEANIDISPDGKYLIYEGDYDYYEDMVIYDIQNDTERCASDPGFKEDDPKFQNNDEITYLSTKFSLKYDYDDTGDVPWNIWIKNLTTGKERMVIENRWLEYYDFNPIRGELIISNSSGTYLINDVANGTWQDSDGDGITDLSDSYPENSLSGYANKIDYELLIVVLLITTVVFVYFYRKRKMAGLPPSEEKPDPPENQEAT